MVRSRYEALVRERQRRPVEEAEPGTPGSTPDEDAAPEARGGGGGQRTAFQGAISAVFSNHLQCGPASDCACRTREKGGGTSAAQVDQFETSSGSRLLGRSSVWFNPAEVR